MTPFLIHSLFFNLLVVLSIPDIKNLFRFIPCQRLADDTEETWDHQSNNRALELPYNHPFLALLSIKVTPYQKDYHKFDLHGPGFTRHKNSQRESQGTPF